MKIGTDIIQIDRINGLLEKFGDTFKEKFLNQEEIKIAKRVESLAGFWAAKEAIAKALGCGIGAELSFHDITINKTSKGAPYFTLSQKAQKKHPVKTSSLSISHDGGFAIAIAAIHLKN
jgi:holo-[acyl-carrier protein] synthase